MRILKLLILLPLGMMVCSSSPAQEVTSAYQFLNVAPDAYVMALGGLNNSRSQFTPAGFISNPALSSDSIDNHAGFNYLAFSKAYYLVSAYYQYKMDRGVLSGGIRHFTTGEIQGYDAAGNPTELFEVAQSAFTVGYSLGYNNFRYGVNINFLNSGIDGYNSNALAFTAGGVFVHPDKDFSIGAGIHNTGFILNDFSSSSNSDLPWDIRIGTTFKPQHMPFRFSLTGHHIFNKNLLNDEISDSKFREILAHVVIGTELIISRNISIFAGYNHLVRQELKLQQTSGGAGFSYGFAWTTKSFQFAYGRGAYHIAGASHMLTLNMNVNRIFRKI